MDSTSNPVDQIFFLATSFDQSAREVLLVSETYLHTSSVSFSSIQRLFLQSDVERVAHLPTTTTTTRCWLNGRNNAQESLSLFQRIAIRASESEKRGHLKNVRANQYGDENRNFFFFSSFQDTKIGRIQNRFTLLFNVGIFSPRPINWRFFVSTSPESLIHPQQQWNKSEQRRRSSLPFVVEMRVLLRNLNGDTLPIDIEPADDVRTLMAKIEAKTGIAPDAQRLIHAGHVLTVEDLKVSYYKIEEGATINISHRGTLKRPSKWTTNSIGSLPWPSFSSWRNLRRVIFSHSCTNRLLLESIFPCQSRRRTSSVILVTVMFVFSDFIFFCLSECLSSCLRFRSA